MGEGRGEKWAWERVVGGDMDGNFGFFKFL